MKILEFIQNLFCGRCISENLGYIKENARLAVELTQAEHLADFYKTKNQTCLNLLAVKVEEDIQEEYWNNKHPKQNITYKRSETDGLYQIDVRNYFTAFDSSIPMVDGDSNDTKALNALKFIRSNIRYVSDKSSYALDEYWAYSYQTLKRRLGDCEDGAILMANITLKSGIPYWRIRLNAGDVKGGGHAYVTYCRETDNQFVVLDWCYWYKHLDIKDRKLHSEERDYYGIWFSWNQKYSFGNMETMVRAPDEFK